MAHNHIAIDNATSLENSVSLLLKQPFHHKIALVVSTFAKSEWRLALQSKRYWKKEDRFLKLKADLPGYTQLIPSSG